MTQLPTICLCVVFSLLIGHSVAAQTPTPFSAPDRFVPIETAATDPTATQIAERLLASALAAEPGTSVTASIAYLPNDRRMVFAWHGPSTQSYGIAGYGTYVFTSVGDLPFNQVYQTPAVEIWIDTAQYSDNFPDLWVLSVRGVNMPFGIWRHFEGLYQHQGNLAP